MTGNRASTGISMDIPTDAPTGEPHDPASRPLLAMHDITVRYGGFTALSHVSLDVMRGRTLGVVGESGAGKSTLARVAAGLIAPRTGTLAFDGSPLAPVRRTREQRRRIQMVFQNPGTSLNPGHTIRRILSEGMLLHGILGRHPSRESIDARCLELLAMVGLVDGDSEDTHPDSDEPNPAEPNPAEPTSAKPPADNDNDNEPTAAAEPDNGNSNEQADRTGILDRYPRDFSGGQRQRIAIARALAVEPDLLIADEATSSLDVLVQHDILELLARLRDERHLTILLITHNLGVIRALADDVAVMAGGRVILRQTTDAFFHDAHTGLVADLLESSRSVALTAARAAGTASDMATNGAAGMP